jgi:hypothetical protein
VGRRLKATWGDRNPLLAVDAAGALPYWTGFDALDMLGLNDAWIAHHPPSDPAGVGIGHDFADPTYVFERRPDVLAWDSGLGKDAPRRRTGRVLEASKRFRNEYQEIHVQVGTDRGVYWVRREGGALGVQRAPGRVEVPFWFLASVTSEPLRPRRGSFAFKLGTRAGRVPDLTLRPGTWTARVEPAGARVALRCESIEADVVRLSQGRAVDIVVTGAGGWVDAVVLERVADTPSASACL